MSVHISGNEDVTQDSLGGAMEGKEKTFCCVSAAKDSVTCVYETLLHLDLVFILYL